MLRIKEQETRLTLKEHDDDDILNMVYTHRFFSSKCSLFHNSNVFSSCIVHILYTECAKIKKNNSGAKRLTPNDRTANL